MGRQAKRERAVVNQRPALIAQRQPLFLAGQPHGSAGLRGLPMEMLLPEPLPQRDMVENAPRRHDSFPLRKEKVIFRPGKTSGKTVFPDSKVHTKVGLR